MTRAPTWFITVFGLGRMRPFPGTWGSIPPVVLAAVLIALGYGPDTHPWVYNGCLIVTLLVFVGACVMQGDAAESRSIKGKDPSEAVADETAGQCFSLMFLPASAVGSGAGPATVVFTLFYAFVCFRIMDIFKPWPANSLQRIPAGWGIVVDDLVAGVYAAVVVQVLARTVG